MANLIPITAAIFTRGAMPRRNTTTGEALAKKNSARQKDSYSLVCALCARVIKASPKGASDETVIYTICQDCKRARP